jgi:hypothetical protein
MNHLNYYTNSKQVKSLYLLAICLLLQFYSYTVFANSDTTKLKQQHYDINDPRNPNCPCHKYQKLAEDEYAKLNKQKKQEIPIVKKEPESTPEMTRIATNSKRKKSNQLFLKRMKFYCIQKFKQAHKTTFKRTNVLCFHWH